MSEFLNFVRPHQGDKKGTNNELKYDSQYGMSKEEFEWRCRQYDKVSSRTPELMRKMMVLTQRMRVHFENDPEGLKMWDSYEEIVLRGYGRSLPCLLGRPVDTPNSVLYEGLMKRKACSKTRMGLLLMELNKFKHGSKSFRLVFASAAVAAGAAVGHGVAALAGSNRAPPSSS